MLMVGITSFGALGFMLAPTLLRLLGVAPDVYTGALGFLRVTGANIRWRLRTERIWTIVNERSRRGTRLAIGAGA